MHALGCYWVNSPEFFLSLFFKLFIILFWKRHVTEAAWVALRGLNPNTSRRGLLIVEFVCAFAAYVSQPDWLNKSEFNTNREQCFPKHHLFNDFFKINIAGYLFTCSWLMTYLISLAIQMLPMGTVFVKTISTAVWGMKKQDSKMCFCQFPL